MSRLFILISTIFVLVPSAFLQHQKLNVDVLYESLCPDSFAFITKDLHPIWKHISPFINLNLVPFGKSRSLENGAKFVCQHGPEECKGNRIQSCVINSIPDQNLQIEFVNCFMQSFKHDKTDFGARCAQSLGINLEIISQCYGTKQGTELQLIAEQKTIAVSPRFIPTILYNGVFDQELQDNSVTNFRDTICELLAHIKPNPCDNLPVLNYF